MHEVAARLNARLLLLSDGKDDSDDCIDVPYPVSDYVYACLLFFFYYPFVFARSKQAANGLF